MSELGWEALLKQYLSSRSLARRTVDAYRHNLKTFVEDAQPPEPRALTREHLRTYYLNLKAGPLEEVTVVNRMRLLLKLLRWAARRDLLLVDLAEDFTIPKPRRNIPKILTREDVDQLIEATQLQPRRFCRARDRALLELLYGTGLRIGEAAELLLSDLHLPELALSVRVSKSRPRLAPFGRHVADALTDYLEERDQIAQSGEMALFIAQHGSRICSSALGNVIRFYSRKTGIAATAHDFRRAFATHLLENGANIVEIKALLGHVDLDTTQFYAQIAPVELTRAFKRSHPRARRPQ